MKFQVHARSLPSARSAGNWARVVFPALAALAAPIAAAACANSESSPSSGPTEQAAQAAVSTAGPASNPPPAPVHAAAAPVTGTVAETMQAASYTYVRLTTTQGDQWAAIPQAQLAVGDTVTIANPMVIDGFQSPTLKRTFDRILFGTLAGRPPPASSLTSNPHAGMLPGATPAAAAPPGPPVPRATGPNAHTIAELVAARMTLKDKPVVVRGRVTKYNGGILGKNWLHLEDGSVTGSGDNTIAVTTTATANVGDVVLVQGVVHTDMDFGAGYSYAVLIEDATVTK